MQARQRCFTCWRMTAWPSMFPHCTLLPRSYQSIGSDSPHSTSAAIIKPEGYADFNFFKGHPLSQCYIKIMRPLVYEVGRFRKFHAVPLWASLNDWGNWKNIWINLYPPNWPWHWLPHLGEEEQFDISRGEWQWELKEMLQSRSRVTGFGPQEMNG